ncbi:PDZ domain-containing protein [Bradyrhizobium sp. 2]|uniref:PDZ domain-containing protein n=1 Tax=unclassified Bradyrhizobium TaxID=2631580 RepID=UPI001FFA3E25|nr:PDZ domain-containing protein [Bradyrhizobium sp. 2]MCK1462962.1 PDZ domain-containing protein [Bradyrhizobium sp. 2]
MGVVVSDLTEAEARSLGVNNGVFVVEVRNDTSASRAGIVSKDVIFALDGGSVRGVSDFVCQVARRHPGDAIHFGILRNFKPLVVTVTLGSWPEQSRSPGRPAGECGIVLMDTRFTSSTPLHL